MGIAPSEYSSLDGVAIPVGGILKIACLRPLVSVDLFVSFLAHSAGAY